MRAAARARRWTGVGVLFVALLLTACDSLARLHVEGRVRAHDDARLPTQLRVTYPIELDADVGGERGTQVVDVNDTGDFTFALERLDAKLEILLRTRPTPAGIVLEPRWNAPRVAPLLAVDREPDGALLVRDTTDRQVVGVLVPLELRRWISRYRCAIDLRDRLPEQGAPLGFE